MKISLSIFSYTCAGILLATMSSAYGQCTEEDCPIFNSYFDHPASSPSSYSLQTSQESRAFSSQNSSKTESKRKNGGESRVQQGFNREGSPNQREINSKQISSYQNKGSDSVIYYQIEETLKNNRLKKNYPLVNIRFYQGMATLSGTVETEDDRQQVESRVRAIQGVADINDQLQVESSTPHNQGSKPTN
ncbi:hypothetical protein DB41_IB01060 [Neochlamydia sp. TUME1]|uniref:BON domain-containing protein n=1 Tax=Neochlamydia sp. TUME1 TaxID=1478174 RepID=UPI00057F800F|nr:BON domain-containing protein [Neochlamydia sp. TUME1]KIC74973.1 hypothetical protein DB41_IB01060 [Neochlamydia sp. TUME1]